MKLMTGMLIFVLTCSTSLAATSNEISRPVPDRELGRVFLTKEERYRLDVQRAAGPVEPDRTGPVEVTGSIPAKKNRTAAGYIVVPSGVQSTWENGEFRVAGISTSAQAVHFPGNVTIDVHRNSTPDAVDLTDSAPDQETLTGAAPPDGGEQIDDVTAP